jgi:N-acetylneuraminic acid mutarotase
MASLPLRLFLSIGVPFAVLAEAPPPKSAAATAPVPVPAPATPPHEGEGDTIHVPPRIEWEKIAELPPRHGEEKNPGLAGVFAGAQGDVLIIAGGTNYPQGFPWTGAKRAVYSDIYVLERSVDPAGTPAFKWIDPQAELPDGVSYGASVSLPDGVLCMGGATLSTVHDACFLLSWNKTERKVETTPFPKLPKALACHAAVLLKNVVYVLGGANQIEGGRATNSFYALDLSKRSDTAAFEWKTLTAWDGPARVFPAAAASLEGDTESLYVCGGRDPGNDPDFLIDLHKYDPVKKEWSLLGDIVDRKGHPGYVMATAAFHVPPHHFVVVGGMDEDITRLLERNARDLKELDETERERRKKYEAQLLENFPGYPRTVMGYDAAIGEWNHIGNFPSDVPLTNPAVNWESQVIIPGGETGPGRRTPGVWAATVRKKPVVVEEEEPAEPASANSVPPPSQIPATAEKQLPAGRLPNTKPSAKPK